EARGVELARELLDRQARVARENVLHDADVRIVVERQVDVRLRDEVYGQPLAGRAADGDADGSVARSEQRERGGKDRPRPLLGVAEEAPGPLPRSDPRRREIAELVSDHLDPRG